MIYFIILPNYPLPSLNSFIYLTFSRPPCRTCVLTYPMVRLDHVKWLALANEMSLAMTSAMLEKIPLRRQRVEQSLTKADPQICQQILKACCHYPLRFGGCLLPPGELTHVPKFSPFGWVYFTNILTLFPLDFLSHMKKCPQRDLHPEIWFSLTEINSYSKSSW